MPWQEKEKATNARAMTMHFSYALKAQTTAELARNSIEAIVPSYRDGASVGRCLTGNWLMREDTGV